MDTKTKIEQRREEARKRQQQIKKRENAKIPMKVKRRLAGIGAGIVVVLLIAALILPNTGLSRRMLKALTIGDTDISVAEYSYYYRTSFSNYYSMLYSYFGGSYMPIDLTKSLKKQAYNDEMSYADYFSQEAINNLQQLIILSEEAKKEGFVLPAESMQSYEEAIASVKSKAAEEGVSVSSYLAGNFGMGFNLTTLENCVYRELLAEAYSAAKKDSFTYSIDELDAYYQEHKQDFDVADFRMAMFSVTEATEDSEGLTAEEAKAQAEEFISGVATEEDFSAKVLARAEAEGTEAKDQSLVQGVNYTSASGVDQNLCDWVFGSETAEGSVAVIESTDGNTYYALYLINGPHRSEEKTVDVRHILIAPADSSAEAEEEAEATAQQVYQRFLAAGASEEFFAELAEANSSDTGSNTNGGLYTGVYRGRMIEEFDAWCFDEARVPGDSGVVKTDYGYHIMYYVGDNLPRWESEVQTTMQSDAYDAWYSSVAAQYPVKEHSFAMKYRSEPI